MGTGFEHTALAVFTTLAPMGAGAFIALAYAFVAGAPDETAAKRLDCWTALRLRCAKRCSWRWRLWPWCSPPSAGWPT